MRRKTYNNHTDLHSRESLNGAADSMMDAIFGGNISTQPCQDCLGTGHVAMVASVSRNGAITVINEFTGKATAYRTFAEFQQAMAEEGLYVDSYGRIEESEDNGGPQALNGGTSPDGGASGGHPN